MNGMHDGDICHIPIVVRILTDQVMNWLIRCTSNNRSTVMVVIVHKTISVKATYGYADRKGTKKQQEQVTKKSE